VPRELRVPLPGAGAGGIHRRRSDLRRFDFPVGFVWEPRFERRSADEEGWMVFRFGPRICGFVWDGSRREAGKFRWGVEFSGAMDLGATDSRPFFPVSRL
jgi:hypothetical protein